MKRIISAFLCLAMLTALISCADSDSGTASSSNSSRLTLSTGATVSVKDYALKGEIYNCEFKVGTAVETIKEAYHYGDEAYWGNASAAESDAETDSSDVKNNIDATPLEIYGENPIRMVTGDAKYYYHPESESNGIAYIAYFGDAYGFRAGISEPQDIKNAVGETATFDDFAETEDLFFFFGEPEDVYKIEYNFDGEYVLAFFFENGKLAATTLYHVNLWSDNN